MSITGTPRLSISRTWLESTSLNPPEKADPDIESQIPMRRNDFRVQ
jgi:hypothetical protein